MNAATSVFDQMPYGRGGIDGEQINEVLSLMDDWQDRYRYIIELGKDLPVLPEIFCTEKNLVLGCQSQVWLLGQCDESGHLRLLANSDALIVRGLIAIVLSVLNGHNPKHVIDYDMDAWISQMGLLQHISAVRGNGLAAMITRIKSIAKAALLIEV